MWPGLLKSSSLESFDARRRIVAALPWAETPVVVPCLASYYRGLHAQIKPINSKNDKIKMGHVYAIAFTYFGQH